MPGGRRSESDHKPKTQLLALREGYEKLVDLGCQEFRRFHPLTLWGLESRKLLGVEEAGGAVRLVFENGLPMQAGYPKQQNGWVVLLGAPSP